MGRCIGPVMMWGSVPRKDSSRFLDKVWGGGGGTLVELEAGLLQILL